jgi:hypothetical protein
MIAFVLGRSEREGRRRGHPGGVRGIGRSGDFRDRSRRSGEYPAVVDQMTMLNLHCMAGAITPNGATIADLHRSGVRTNSSG